MAARLRSRDCQVEVTRLSGGSHETSGPTNQTTARPKTCTRYFYIYFEDDRRLTRGHTMDVTTALSRYQHSTPKKKHMKPMFKYLRAWQQRRDGGGRGHSVYSG